MHITILWLSTLLFEVYLYISPVIVAHLLWGFLFKPIQSVVTLCVHLRPITNLVEGCENGAGNRRKYDTRKHLEDACTGVNSPKTSKRMQVDVIRPLKGLVIIREFETIIQFKGKVRWLFGLICSKKRRTAKPPKGHSIPTWLVLPRIRVKNTIYHIYYIG